MWKLLIPLFLVVFCQFQASSLSRIAASSDFEEYKFMNLSVDPCDDFYEFSCGNFENYYPLKDEDLVIDQFSILEDDLLAVINKILISPEEEIDPAAVKKMKAAYSACLDENFINNEYMKSPEVEIVNAYGGFPIIQQPGSHIDTPLGWNGIADLAAEFGINIFFSVSSYYDTQNASAMDLMIINDSTDIPTQFRPMYPESYDEAIEEGFYNFATGRHRHFMLTKTDVVSPFDLFLRKLVLKLRRDLGSWQTDEDIYQKVSEISMFMNGIYNGGYIPDNLTIEQFNGSWITLKELNAWTFEYFGNSIELDWVEYIRRLFQYTYADINEDTPVLVTGGLSTTIYGILNWVRINDPHIVKSTALLRAFVYMASDSDSETRRDFEEYLQSINKTVYDRWEYCSRKLMDITETLSLSLAVAYEYQLKYFNKTKFQKATELIQNLQSSFKEVMEEAVWMDDDSKRAALTKVNNIITLLGYPKFVSDRELLDEFYENLPMTKWNHYGNSKELRAFKQSYMLNMISKRDRAAWEKSPFITNAYYNRQNNRIIFPVAMLNPIFFSGTASLLDYSRIGMIVAHEITHGFDSQGCLYNEDGIIKYWWSDETMTQFGIKAKCFIEQYSKYIVPEINSTMNSNNSLNENLADNGGTRTALRAFKEFVRTKNNFNFPGSDQFTIDQMFFIGFGTMWCSNESIEYLNMLKDYCDVNSGCHPRAKIRVNGVISNMKEFAEAFSCPSGSPMNPEIKCRLW